jgi:hypothetical protein
MRATEEPSQRCVRPDVFPTCQNREDPVGAKPTEGERQRRDRRWIYPVEIVNNYCDDPVGTLDEPQELYQSCPAGQGISSRSGNIGVGGQPGAYRKCPQERGSHPEVHSRLQLGTSN